MYLPQHHPILEYFRRIDIIKRIFFALFPKQLVGRGYKIAKQMLFDIVAALDEAGVPYHLDYGTLLGMVRDGDFIPWDDDIDLAIFPDDMETLRGTYDALRQRGWKVREFELPPTFDNDSSGWRPGDTWMVRVSKPATPWFPREYWADLLIKRIEGAHISWIIIWQDQANICSADSAHISRSREHSYSGGLFQIPESAEAYLAHLFGDWQKPMRNFDARTQDGAIIRTLPISSDA